MALETIKVSSPSTIATTKERDAMTIKYEELHLDVEHLVPFGNKKKARLVVEVAKVTKERDRVWRRQSSFSLSFSASLS